MPKGNSVRRFRINNFSGGMNTMAEDNALMSIDPNANLGVGFTQIRTEMRNIENFVPLNRGGVSKSLGFSEHYNFVDGGLITGLYRFTRSNGNNYFLIGCVDKLYTLLSGVTTDTGATLTENAYLSFETALDYCVICDGASSPMKYDGATVTTLGGTPPVGARQSIFYQNRLWMFSSTTNQSLLFYSDPTDIESGYPSNFVQCDVNDGQRITSISKFFIPGQLTPVILVGKERSVGIVTGDGTTESPYTFKKIAFDLGIPGFRQIVQFGQDAAFLTPQGVNSYDTSLRDVNLKMSQLSANIQDQFFDMNQGAMGTALGWLDWKNNLLSFAVPVSASEYPNVIWNLNLRQGGWSKQTGFNITALLVDTDGTIYHGDETGTVYIHNPNDYAYGDLATLEGLLETAYLDFGQPVQYKKLNWVSITTRGQGSYSLTASTKLNFGTQIGSTHSITPPSRAYSWGAGLWTDNPSVYQWGQVPLVTQKFYPKGIFQNIAFTFAQPYANQPLDIFEMNFEVEYLNLT